MYEIRLSGVNLQQICKFHMNIFDRTKDLEV